MTPPLRRALTVVPRIISEAEGLVDYIASDESLDSYQEIIAAKGWRFSRFAKNAPFVDSHDYESIQKLLGRVESAGIVGTSLIERVRWAKDVKENALAQLGWKMTLGGFLKAVSVGFFPVRRAFQGREGWAAAVADLGIKPEDAANVRCIYLEQEQIELSACIIGANPNALAKSFKEGCIQDADLAACGFTDADMAFLTLAGAAMEKPETDALTRALIGREMARITGRAPSHSPDGITHPNSNPPGKPGGGGLAERQAAERKAFIEKLSNI